MMELVFIPSSGMGHLLPTVELAKHIVQRNPNISITFLVYYLTNESSTIKSYFDFMTRDAVLDRVTFVTLPRLSESNLPDPSSPAFYHTVLDLQKPFVKQAIKARNTKPTGVVCDLVSIPMMDVAHDLDIPCYIFFTSSPTYLNTIFQIQAIADDQGTDFVTELLSNPNTELDLLGFRNRVPAKVLPGVLLQRTWRPAMFSLARVFRKAKGIFVNSFMELDSLALDALQQQNNVPTIFPVGPLLSLDRWDGPSPKTDLDDVVSWLDQQRESSVVFLCFGSTGCFDEGQAKEIANGLDACGHPFLWILRMASSDDRDNKLDYEDALPEGFLDRTAHRGKVIPWAPQITVLAHKAIGGFVSHCGWNSILESIWFGIPIATWPMHSEQQLNAFTLVKELGLGVEISLDYRWDSVKQEGNVLVTSDEVKNGVKKLMNIDEDTRVKLRHMSGKCKKALQEMPDIPTFG